MSNLSNETTEEQLVHILNYYEVDSFSDVKREILNLINSEALKLLDRLEAQWGETIDNTLGKPIRIKFVSVSAIQAERAKLKEVK